MSRLRFAVLLSALAALAFVTAGGGAARTTAAQATSPKCAITAKKMSSLLDQRIGRLSLDQSNGSVHACYYWRGSDLRALVIVAREPKAAYDSKRKAALADDAFGVRTPIGNHGKDSYFACFGRLFPECQLAVRRGRASTFVNLTPAKPTKALSSKLLAQSVRIVNLLPKSFVPSGTVREDLGDFDLD